MARVGNLHSRIVAWLKVILPLAALVSLSLLFLVARTVNPEDAIPYARVDIEDRVREPRITMPSYAGVTADGAALTIDADAARPDNAATGATANADKVRGRLDTPDGGTTHLAAAAARMAEDGQSMVLSGGVTITSSTGYVVTAPEMVTALKTTDVASGGGEVTATGPVGNLRADQMHLTLGDKGYLLVFNGGVRLIYQPPN